MQFRRGKPYRDKTNHRWVAVWYVGGQRQRERTPFTKKVDVERYVTQIEVQFEQQLSEGSILPFARREAAMIRLEDAVQKFLDAKSDLALYTQKQYKGILNNFLAFLGDDRPTAALRPIEIQRFLDAHKQTGVRPATLAADLRVIRAFDSWCKRERITHTRFASTEDVPSIPTPRGRPRYLKCQQVAPFLKACTKDFRPIALITIFGGGLRRKEVVNLQWSNWDEIDEMLWVTRAKKERYSGEFTQPVPLHPLATQTLRHVERISDYTFPVIKDTSGPGGVKVFRGDRRSETTQWFLDATQNAAEAIGLPRTSLDFHGLRRTFAKLVHDVSGDLRLTGDLLGHSPGKSITNDYIFADLDRQREVIQAIDIGATYEEIFLDTGSPKEQGC
jgi:integrase